MTQRPQSTVWQFYVTVPPHLTHHFKGPWAYRKSLGTRDLPEANRRAKLIDAEWVQRFRELEAQDNPQVVTLTPTVAADVAAEVRRWVLQADDNMRDFPEGPRALVDREERQRLLAIIAQAEASPLAALWPLEPGPAAHAGLTIAGATAAAPAARVIPPHDPLAGIPEDQREALARFNAEADGRAAVDLAGRNLRAVLPMAEAVTKSMGKRADWGTPEGRAGLLEVLKAYRAGRADLTRRDVGDVVNTPAQAPMVQAQEGPQEGTGGPAVQSEGRRMGDALTAWEGLGVRKPKTVSVFTRHVGQFKDMTGDPLLSTIGKPSASRFRADLQRWAVEKGKTRETADNVLATIKALANVAVGEDWMVSNPFAGLAVTEGGKEAEAREPWTPEELPTLFASPVFTSYRMPPADSAMSRKAGLDAAYWVPLLCLFTGARPGEVCQLWTDDLSEVRDSKGNPLLVLEFRANKERGQSLKNPSSWRALPIHSELIRLGIRDYLMAVIERQGPPGPLFPAIPKNGANGPGGQFGQWFGDFKKAHGFHTTKTLHSFRHTVETELGFAEVSPTLVDAITGHEGKGVGRKRYAATIRRNSVRLRPHLEKLTFPGLNLPRVFTVPTWKP